MMNHTKTFKKFTCCKCLNDWEVMSDRDTHPLFLCSSCILAEQHKNTIIVQLDGAPAGRVKGSSTPCKLRNVDQSFKG